MIYIRQEVHPKILRLSCRSDHIAIKCTKLSRGMSLYTPWLSYLVFDQGLQNLQQLNNATSKNGQTNSKLSGLSLPCQSLQGTGNDPGQIARPCATQDSIQVRTE